jgi:ssDNA-binding Zn-finger/Zn-ribbon topoisomerase 1
MSRHQGALESSITNAIMRELKKHPHIVVRKRHGTGMGVAGDPDLYGVIRGQHFEIEVKRLDDPDSQCSQLQLQRLLEWHANGALVGVARSVNDALCILGLAVKKPALDCWVCDGCRKYRWNSETAPARCPKCGHTRFTREEVLRVVA